MNRAEPKKEKKPLVISPLPNVDFRSNAQHKKELYIPAQPQQHDGEAKPEVLEQTAAYGLQIQKRKVESNSSVTVEETTIVTAPVVKETETVKTLEERAVEAILKGKLSLSPHLLTIH